MENDNKQQNNPPTSILDEALGYLTLGFSIIPLGSITKDSSGKKDIKYMNSWKKYQDVIATPEEVHSWNFENLGIVTGQISGLLVLDVDSYKESFDADLFNSFNLPVTPMQETASGGRQYFFKYPKDIVIKNAVCIGHEGSGIDIRGDGGMVICPPSKTPYGKYMWHVSPFGTPLADIPTNLLDILSKKPEEEKGLKTRKLLPELVGLKDGAGRNNALATLIGKLLVTVPRDRWDEEVWPVAVDVNNTYKPPLSQEEVLGIYSSITKIESERKTKPEKEKVPFLPAMSHSELMARKFPPVRYTVEPFFEQGAMNMVSAPPNTWKSWLFFDFARHIATGSLALDKFPTGKANVMIVNEEDSARMIQDRLKLLGIIDATLPIYYRIAHGSKLEESFVDNLIKEAKEKKVEVIMFDSLRAIHEADENSSKEMQQVMDLFKKIVREGITVIFTHHNRKKSFGRSNDDAESSRGSSAINAAISGHISLEEVNNEDGKILVVHHQKSKVGEKLPPFEIEITADPSSVGFKYLGEHKAKEKALTEASTRILAELEGREELLSRNDLVYLKIGGKTTVKNATNALVKEGKLKVMTRKEVKAAGLKTLKDGKTTENLYCLNKEDVETTVDFGDFNNDCTSP